MLSKANTTAVGAGLAVLLAAIGVAFMRYQRYQRRCKSTIHHVGYVESLHLYPVKSCAGVEVDKATCQKTGLEAMNFKDRHFVVISAGTEKDPTPSALYQRHFPRMGLVKVTASSNSSNQPVFTFSAPEMPDLHLSLPLPKENEIYTADQSNHKITGRDCGKKAAAWWQKYLGKDNVLLLHADDDSHLKLPTVDPSKMPASEIKHRVENHDRTAFSFFSPLHLVNSASVDNLNTRIVAASSSSDRKEPAITTNNFRPNIVIRTNTPFEEDDFDEVYISSSPSAETLAEPHVALRRIKMNARCILTMTNYENGKRRTDGEPLKTLRSFRMRRPDFPHGPLFGVDLGVDRCGEIKKGDAVFAELIHK